MPPPICNKCKSGECSEGDSWCTGCSSLELSLSLLKQPWVNKGVRKIAEEACLSAARLVRAFKNLDRGLSEAPQGSSGATSKARAAPARSRSPRRDTRPPLTRAPTPPAPPSPPREAARERRAEPRRDVSIDDEEEEESEEEHSEGRGGFSGEEEDKGPVKREDTAGDRSPDLRRPAVPRGPPPPRERREQHHREDRRDHRDHRRSHHHEGESEYRQKDKKKKKKKKRRGGARHQRHYREVEDPLRRSHRKLSAEESGLAGSFREGLERRA